jgi:hypothetical protein
VKVKMMTVLTMVAIGEYLAILVITGTISSEILSYPFAGGWVKGYRMSAGIPTANFELERRGGGVTLLDVATAKEFSRSSKQ